jgi:hypothetical protein
MVGASSTVARGAAGRIEDHAGPLPACRPTTRTGALVESSTGELSERAGGDPYDAVAGSIRV